MRKICYVSGSRADFGLMRRTLCLAAQQHPKLDVSVCVTGMHLVPDYGNTVDDIEASGLRIAARIPVYLDGTSGAVMARAIGHELGGLVDALEAERPDLVLVLGDRGEMLAGALAAIHLNIPVAHIHGGERSGTIDESVRHAVSKLAHFHFVATEQARDRLVRMGECPERVFVTGAPGLDDLSMPGSVNRAQLCKSLDLDPGRPVGLVIYHPVVQEVEDAGQQVEAVMHAVLESGMQAICLMPNADAGGDQIRTCLQRYSERAGMRVLRHMPRQDYVTWMAVADVMVGNSSSGIIEAASFHLPVINIGTRQRLREQSSNVINVPADAAVILAAVKTALASPRKPVTNIYGDGNTAPRIVGLLASLPLDSHVLTKANVY